MSALEFEDLEWGDAEALARNVSSSEYDENLEMLRGIHAPFPELVCTPMSARACALGHVAGRDFFHHEGRSRIVTPEWLQPELQVDEAGCDPVWDFGVFRSPKYFSFFQDAPFAAYHANHRAKWRAHEMLHGAAKFFWRPDMSRFETYVGARLNELVPVVHWYHFDEMGRARCPDHRHKIPKQWCSHCEDVVPYWESSPELEPGDLVKRANDGFQHFDQEMAACLLEIETGSVQETHFCGLNASTDAVAYMRAHWNRTTGNFFGMWMEMFMQNTDYFRSVRDYAQHIRGVANALVSGKITIDASSALARNRRCAQDLGYRFLFWAETQADPDAVLERCVSDLEALSSQMTEVGCAEFIVSIGEKFDDPKLFVLGWHDHDIEQLQTGLQSVSDDQTNDVLQFSQSSDFWGRGTIAERYDRFLTEHKDDTSWTLSAAVCALPRIDLEAERFASVPESVSKIETGRLRVNETTRRIDEVSIGYHFYATFRVVAWNESLAAIFDAIDNEVFDLKTIDVPMLMELIDAGLFVWFPEVTLRSVRRARSES